MLILCVDYMPKQCITTKKSHYHENVMQFVQARKLAADMFTYKRRSVTSVFARARGVLDTKWMHSHAFICKHASALTLPHLNEQHYTKIRTTVEHHSFGTSACLFQGDRNVRFDDASHS